LMECRHLAERASPDIPCLCFLGEEEAIVDTICVHERMSGWPCGQLEIVPGSRHEVLMEVPRIRTRVLDRLASFYSGARDTAA
ncbi:MAG: alpha/beta hydrolase, partial [Rhodobacteraceae bacterium]|nr:alpha/beta hydrolase [Paracoccaceae bacterium]